MKRKASALDEYALNADWPVLDYSSSTSTASPESIKAPIDHESAPTLWNGSCVPYLSLRTRKRHRDDRPEQEIIHQNTLAKLFNAQKQIHAVEEEQQRRHEWRMSSPAVSPLTLVPPRHREDGSMMMWPTSTESLDYPEQNQRSIDSFFGIASNGPVQNRRPATSIFQMERPLRSVSTASRCEDCGTVLQSTYKDTTLPGTEVMDMDRDMDDCEWACVSCLRRVCDTCAVRGNYRICLECAVPGGG